MDVLEIIKIIWPLIVIQLAFQVYALVDLISVKKKKTRNLNTTAWVLIIIFGEILGAGLYFILGRNDQ